MSDTLQLSLPEFERREKISQTLKAYYAVHQHKTPPSFKGRKHTEETKQRISRAKKGQGLGEKRRKHTAEARRKMSASHKLMVGPKHIMYGKRFSVEARRNMSEGAKHRPPISDERREQMSRVNSRKNNPNWQGGISYLPYCPKFNNRLKEEIRNRDNRTCAICGKSTLQNGRRLTVHHIDGDKMQGCQNTPWYLISLCGSCHSYYHNTDDHTKAEFLLVSNIPYRLREIIERV